MAATPPSFYGGRAAGETDSLLTDSLLTDSLLTDSLLTKQPAAELLVDNDLDAAPPDVFYFPRRYVFIGLSLMGTTASYMLRSNLSTAIIPMAAQFGWSKAEQGTVLSAFFIGYVLVQLPGGLAAMRFGGSRVFLAGICAAAVLTLLTPLAAVHSLASLVALRVCQGFVEGGMYPAMHTLIAAWALPNERSVTASWIYSGNYLGTALGLGLTGALLASDAGGRGGGASPWAWARIAGGSSSWPAAFYTQGVAVLVWAAVWAASVYSSPLAHPSIHASERGKIEASRPSAPPPTLASIRAIPWRAILTNVPFYAVVVNHFVTNFCNYILMSWSTTYIKEQLHTPVDAAGLLGLLPYLAAWAVSLGAGVAADALISTGTASTTTVRKAWQCIALCACGLLLASMGYVGSSVGAMAMLTLAVGFLGFTESGYHCNHVDLFPAHAGIAFALTNVVGNMGGVVGPSLVGVILNTSDGSDASPAQWRTVFFVCAALNGVGALVWAAFASGRQQM